MRWILIIAALTASAIILLANASIESVDGLPPVFGERFAIDEPHIDKPVARASSTVDRAKSANGKPADNSTSMSAGTVYLPADARGTDRATPTSSSGPDPNDPVPVKPRGARLLYVDSLALIRGRTSFSGSSSSNPASDQDDRDALPRARYRSVDSVSIRLASDAVLSTLPNNTLTVVLAVTNTSRRPRSVVGKLDVPDGWIIVRSPGALELGPASTTIQFVMLKIPGNSPSGDFEIEFVLEDSGKRRLLASAAIVATVETVYEITLDVQSEPEFIPAGETYDVTFLLHNNGNIRVPVDLEVHGASVRDVELDVSETVLEPGESVEVVAVARTKADLLRPTANRFRLSAQLDGRPDVGAVASSGVDVVPVFGRIGPQANPMDVLLTVGGVGDDYGSGLVYRAEGNGEIFGGRLDFDMQFPDRRDAARFGRRDEYRSSFRSDNLSIVLGDQAFNLSPLTTIGDYAFGAGGTVRTGAVEVDAFGQRSRATILDYSLAGGGIQIHTSDQASVGVNVLHREGLYDGTITTVRSTLSPMSSVALDMECGIDDTGGVQNPACSVELQGKTARIFYRGKLLRTGDSYPGSSSDLTLGSAGLELRLPSGWTVRGDFSGLDRGAVTGVERSLWSSLAAIGYRAGRGRTSVSGNLQLISSREEHVGNGERLDRSEQLLRFNSSYHFPVVSVSLAVETGRSESDSRGYSGSLSAQRLGIQLNPHRAYYLAGYVDHHSGFVSSAPIDVDRWFSGVQASWKPASQTRIQASLSRSLDNSVTRRAYTMYEGRLDHRLPWGHRISAHVRRSVDDGRLTTRLTDYRFGYSVPLSIPLPNTGKSSSKVFGRVYDLATGEGVEGILLHLGDKMTLTDERGRFRFPAPLHETEYLRVNQRSIGIDQVTHVAMPIPILPAEQDFEIDIPITAGANLSGVIMRYGQPSGRPLIGKSDPIEPIEGMQGVIVEARSGERVFRTRTNDRGRFAFLNIPPGEYNVRIVRASIPSLHRWETEETVIDLQPADDRMVRFKLVPIRRTIRRIDGGAVQLVPRSK